MLRDWACRFPEALDALQAAAEACAVAECGPGCAVQARFSTGQCGAFAISRLFEWAAGVGIGADSGAAIEQARIECRRAPTRTRCQVLNVQCID